MATKKPRKIPNALVNRRASFDYALGDELTAGIVLSGPEARAARDGHVQLKGAFVSLRNGELWLNNASFSLKLNQRGSTDRTIDTTARKLLVKRRDIEALDRQKQDGFSIVPTRILTKTRYIKVVIALGKGKKRYDKRETIKRRDQDRETKRILKDHR